MENELKLKQKILSYLVDNHKYFYPLNGGCGNIAEQLLYYLEESDYDYMFYLSDEDIEEIEQSDERNEDGYLINKKEEECIEDIKEFINKNFDFDIKELYPDEKD